MESRVTQSKQMARVHGVDGFRVQGQAVERDATQQPQESAGRFKTKENDASVTRLPGNDESFENNPASKEE